MKLIDMGHGAVAIEPDEKTDRIAPPDLSKLADSELTAETIKTLYRHYIDGLLSDTSIGENDIG
jgi:hypothetical protein